MHVRRQWILYLTVVAVIVLVLSTFPHDLSAQANPTPPPTPEGITVLLGGNNMGPVQPFTLPEVIQRTGIRSWHDAGWTGRNQSVGVLDLGFGGLTRFEQSLGLSVSLMPGEDLAEYDADTISHGTEVLEVLHAIAPNAELHACRYGTYDQFVQCINWMVSAGVRIINHSAGVPALPLDGTNEWAMQVDRVARQGILWINAAGNFAGGYVSDFFTDVNLNRYHEFRGGRGPLETLGVEPIAASQGSVLLSWNGREGSAANTIDLDLEIIGAGDEVIAQSNHTQRGNPGETPLERVVFQMDQPFGIRIVDVDGRAEGVQFVLFVEFASVLGGSTQGSVIAPADSQSALTVGALQGNVVAPYSSRGLIDAPLIKPDLVAPGEIILADQTQFFGTSAAAPVVSGVAALIWEANPTFSREEVYSFLRMLSTQDDAFFPGPDDVYGFGYVYLPVPSMTAIAQMPTSTTLPPPVQNIPTSTPSPSPTTTPAELVSTSTPTQPVTSGDGPVANVSIASANLRSGPGTNYDVVGSAEQGEELAIVAQAYDSTWYLVTPSNGQRAWIASSVVTINMQNQYIEIAATIPPQPLTTSSTVGDGQECGADPANSPPGCYCPNQLHRANFDADYSETVTDEWGVTIYSQPGVPGSEIGWVRPGGSFTILNTNVVCYGWMPFFYVRNQDGLEGYIRYLGSFT